MKSWSEIETQTSWLQIQPFPLLSWITKSGVFAGEGEFTRGCTAAGQECSKLSFVRKFIFFKVEILGQRWLVLRRFFSWLFPRSESPTLSSEWQRAPTRAAPAPASLLSFFHWKILKVSFLPDTEWKTPLEMSGVFHKWHFLFPDWLWTTGSYTLFAPMVLSAKNSHILPLMVNLELKHMRNCSAAILSLICQCRVCINAANPASGYGSLNSSLQPQE